jgi:hypothetical protein
MTGVVSATVATDDSWLLLGSTNIYMQLEYLDHCS